MNNNVNFNQNNSMLLQTKHIESNYHLLAV